MTDTTDTAAPLTLERIRELQQLAREYGCLEIGDRRPSLALLAAAERGLEADDRIAALQACLAETEAREAKLRLILEVSAVACDFDKDGKARVLCSLCRMDKIDSGHAPDCILADPSATRQEENGER